MTKSILFVQTHLGGEPGPVGLASLDFLDLWREERQLADELLTKHSTWLRSFREQVRDCGQSLRIHDTPKPLINTPYNLSGVVG